MNRKYMYTSLGILSLIVALAIATSSSAAPTVTQTSMPGISSELLTVGTEFTYNLDGVNAQKSTLSAVGDTLAGAVEITTSNPIVRTALTKANYAYKVTVTETTDGGIVAGTYKVELFQDETSKGALYVSQNTQSVGTEGFVAKWDIGTTLPSGDSMFEVKITKVA